MPKYKIPLIERFSKKYDISENDCWEWNGALRNDGYGILKIDGRCEGAHRYSYLIHKGEYDKSLCVLHTCDNRKCVNPDHLFTGTKRDNIIDCLNKQRRKEIPCANSGLYKSNCKCDACREAVNSKARLSYLIKKSK